MGPSLTWLNSRELRDLVTFLDGLRDGVRDVDCISRGLGALVAFVSASTALVEFSVTFVTLVVFPAASMSSVTLVVALHVDHPELGCISRSLRVLSDSVFCGTLLHTVLYSTVL